MSKGTGALIGLLGLASLIFVAVMALVVVIFRLFPDADGLTYPEVFWASLLRTLDPGTMGGDQGPGFRGAMLVVTIGGIILVASLIGIISSGFNNAIENLRKGRSRVLESDHTIILGWSSKAIPIIQELCIANESKKRAAIVVLSDRDKIEVEDELKDKVSNRGKTKFVVRSGNPMSIFDIEITNPESAQSVILLAPDDAEHPDNFVLKSALALVNNPKRSRNDYNIVGEIQSAKNLEAAELIGKNEASWIYSQDFINRITVQASRQSGLSEVFTELLDFDGDEIYFSHHSELSGKTFLDAQLSFESSAVIGLVSDDRILLNPPAETIVSDTDSVVAVALDDSAVVVGERGVPNLNQNPQIKTVTQKAEKTLVLGVNHRLAGILEAINDHVARGSSVLVVADSEPLKFPRFRNISVSFRQADITTRRELESLAVTKFDHVIVLAESAKLGAEQADAQTLITLLQLRKLAHEKGAQLNIVTEMMDDRNRELVEDTDSDDFIVSDKLVGLLMSQLSQNPRLAEIFTILFRSQGIEVALKPAQLYVPLNEPVTFYTVVKNASDRGETAFGHRTLLSNAEGESRYLVKVNPAKTNSQSYQPGDSIIVLTKVSRN